MATVPVEDTATIGGKITASAWNGDVRDGVNFLQNPPRCSVFHSAAITPATATVTLQPYDSEVYDTDSMHSTSTNTSRMVAVTAGLYHVVAGVQFAVNATGVRGVQIRKNAIGSNIGGILIGGQNYGAGTVAGSDAIMVKDVQMAANDYLEVFVYQSSGGALATVPGDGVSWASMRWVASS